MKLMDVKDKIDSYFDNITPEEFYKTLIKYHMRTVFEGTINGRKFDNIQAYNAEMQRLIAAGEPVQASTCTKAAPEVVDTSFLFPGFAQCENSKNLTKEFIDAALECEPNKFIQQVNGLFHDKIKPAIGQMNKEQLDQYLGTVKDIRKFLEGCTKESEEIANKIVDRLNEINKDLEKLQHQADMESDRRSVIDFVSSLYEAIDKAVAWAGGQLEPEPKSVEICTCQPGDACCACGDPAGPQGEKGIVTPGAGYLETIRSRARNLFSIG